MDGLPGDGKGLVMKEGNHETEKSSINGLRHDFLPVLPPAAGNKNL